MASAPLALLPLHSMCRHGFPQQVGLTLWEFMYRFGDFSTYCTGLLLKIKFVKALKTELIT